MLAGTSGTAATAFPSYTCTVGQTHILCMCCLQPLPDRRTDAKSDPDFPKLECKTKLSSRETNSKYSVTFQVFSALESFVISIGDVGKMNVLVVLGNSKVHKLKSELQCVAAFSL